MYTNPLARQAIAIILLSLVLLGICSILLRRIRSRNENPKYIPTPFLKRLWRGWKVGPPRGDYRRGAQDEDQNDSAYYGSGGPPHYAGNLPNHGGAAQGGAAGGSQGILDRSTSIRSVMTLPAYMPQAGQNERVLGVEGERDGIDIVVEFPRAEAEDEALREEEMEALYQIRLARRRAIEGREERRRLRREARERNDVVALEELRRRREDGRLSTEQLVEELRREHERIKEQRQRAVSSVSYADVGIARHDGTRVRANSTESTERIGLLSDAASMGGNSARSSGIIVPSVSATAAAGPSNALYITGHRRDRSASSVVSVDSDLPSPGLSTSNVGGHNQRRSRANSHPDTPGQQHQQGGAGSSPEMIGEADLGDADMPPPGYDEVSLADDASGHRSSFSRGPSPHGTPTPNEPPPDYAELERRRAARRSVSAQAASGGIEPPEQAAQRGRTGGGITRGVGGVPQLPSLRLSRLPQIVVEPSSARPGE